MKPSHSHGIFGGLVFVVFGLGMKHKTDLSEINEMCKRCWNKPGTHLLWLHRKEREESDEARLAF